MFKKIEVNPLEGSIWKGMLIFALPITVSALLTMLFSCADTIVVGRFGHENAISAIGVSASVLNFLIGGVIALETGVTVTAGKHYGEKNYVSIQKMLHSIPLTALLLGTVLSACAIAFSGQILRLLNCPDVIFNDAITYFRIYFLGVPFTVASAFLSAMMQAKGNSFTPFFFQILASLLNIVLNLFFVIFLDLNIIGVAVATVISQAVLLLAVIIYLTKQTDELKLNLRKLTLFSGTKAVFSIGIPSSVEGAVMNLSSVIISSVINRFDTNVIAGNTVATTVEGLMVISFTGFAGASTVFISQNHGAKNAARILKTYKLTIASVFIMAETLGLLLYIFSPKLLLLFTSEQVIIENARIRMFYMCLFFGLCGIMNVISGCERGLGDSKTPLIISIICSVIFRLTWIFTYAAWKGTIEAVYVSYPICWGLCVILNMIAFRAIFRKRCGYAAT